MEVVRRTEVFWVLMKSTYELIEISSNSAYFRSNKIQFFYFIGGYDCDCVVHFCQGCNIVWIENKAWELKNFSHNQKPIRMQDFDSSVLCHYRYGFDKFKLATFVFVFLALIDCEFKWKWANFPPYISATWSSANTCTDKRIYFYFANYYRNLWFTLRTTFCLTNVENLAVCKGSKHVQLPGLQTKSPSPWTIYTIRRVSRIVRYSIGLKH